MGRNDKEKIISPFNAIVDLILVVHPQGNVIKIKPHCHASIYQRVLDASGKQSAVCPAVGDKDIL